MRIPLLLAAWLLTSVAQATPLSAQLEAAWKIDTEARALDARAGELRARGLQINSLLAAPPSVAVSYRGDNLTGNTGQREYEAELGLPLWLPGQRNANQSALTAEFAALEAERVARRLNILGALREKNSTLRRAQADLDMATARLQEARALEADVERRYKAGDLARTDFLAARMETLAVMRDLSAREVARDAARADLKMLSGAEQAAPAETTAGVSVVIPPMHPDLVARQATLAAAQEKLHATRQNRRDAPELSLFGRSERGSGTAVYDNSLGVRFKLPLATEARNAPLLAQAQGEADIAEAHAQQVLRMVEAQIKQSERELTSAKQALEFARQRAELSQEHYRHLRRAFDYGERDLATLLRAKALADSARLEAVLAQVETEIAIGRLNQALGVMP